MIPLEILKQIFEAACFSGDFPDGGRVHKTKDIGKRRKGSWLDVVSLGWVSKAYREIFLEAWFRILYIRQTQELDKFCEEFPEVAKWTRFLHCNIDLFDKADRFNLRKLEGLEMIQLDIGSSANTGGVRSPFQLFLNVPPRLSELQVNQANFNFQPQGLIFDEVERFSNLRVLGLRASMTWCDLCELDEALVLKRPSPGSLVYWGSNMGLPLKIRKALAVLTKLEVVMITSETFSLANGDGSEGVHIDPETDTIFWQGECERHVKELLRNEEVRDQWINAKLNRSFQVPNLKKVEWHFFAPEAMGSLHRRANGRAHYVTP